MSIKKIKNLNPISIFILFTFIALSLQECPRDKPILKNNECTSDYCSAEEFQSQLCVISNNIIQTQWLNAIHITDMDYTTQITSTMSDNGTIFITSQEQEGVNNKYFFGLDQNGQGIFYNKTTNSYRTFIKIELPENKISANEKYIEINNRGYLISAPMDNHIFLYDYLDNSYNEFLLKTPALYSDSVIKYIDHEDVYFTSYIHCNDTDHKICHTKLLSFYLNDFDYTADEIFSVDIPNKFGARSRCLSNEKKYIQCMLQVNSSSSENQIERVLNLYSPLFLARDFHFVLEENDYNGTHFIERMINLKKNIYVIVYCSGKNQIKVLIKNIVYYEEIDSIGNFLGSNYLFDNYIPGVKEIILNNDSLYNFENKNPDQNSMAKISEDKFAIFLVDNSNDKNSKLIIYILNLFNLDKNINVRHYTINFGLYGHKIADNVRGFYLNDFLGISIGLSEIDYSDNNIKSGFIVFGYINSTDQNSIDTNFHRNDSNSILKLKNYINSIENNLFGYEYLGIRILYLPEAEKSGAFYINEQKININDTLDIESTLKFILSKNYEPGTYSIKFAGAVQEPDLSRLNSIAEKTEYYPSDGSQQKEELYYSPKILIGKEVNYKFKLGDCFENCETCITISGDENYQLCRKCKPGFYFVENTKNCFKKLDKYYLDKTSQTLRPCHKNCETCYGPPLNELQMNCKSCDIENNYFLYDSTNCLKCPKYVNYLQTDCIDEIPKGYFLVDVVRRTLGKCHILCETCIQEPFFDEGEFFMNCITCVYKIDNWKLGIYGTCPTPDAYYEYEEEEEEDIIKFECPADKPIYKNSQCILDYCDEIDYYNEDCIVSNRYIKTQWVNNFHTFDDDYTSHLSVDINERGDVLISAQEDYNPNHKYFFGFDKNGTGIFL